MLEKNENFFCDAHFHYLPCVDLEAFCLIDNWLGCSCAHSQKEWQLQYDFSKNGGLEEHNSKLYCAFGIHPQQSGDSNCKDNFDFLEFLLKRNEISAIGECGFDFFSEKYKAYSSLQEEYFNIQLDLAAAYNKPVVIHCRKANEKLFEYSSKLKKLSAVLFHSFMGTCSEAESLMKRGINCYFSFGRQLFNGNKKVIECTRELPQDRLLLETDAPFQFLKNESKTFIGQIKDVYIEAFNLRKSKNPNVTYEEFSKQMFENLVSLFYEYK